ncbi:MAG: hypothetical protein ACLFWH_12815 [Actinomycetota bacterium]
MISGWRWRWAWGIEGYRWTWLEALATGVILLISEIVELFFVRSTRLCIH